MPSSTLAPRFTPPALDALAVDDRQFRAVLDVVAAQLATVQQRLADLRRQRVPQGSALFQRDLEIESLRQRSSTLTRLGTEICMGRFDRQDGSRTWVGRIGVRDEDGRPLLVDWRTPAAEPYFAATLQDPLGVVRRRRFRWAGGLVVDAWDEWLDLTVEQEQTGLQDAQSAFLASLAAARSDRMSSALATISADQDAIVRADARGCTVVDGGPGTGKTVVALHRAAYLAFSGHDPVLYVTKHPRLAAYVQDVLPSLGEEDVPVASLEELYADGASRRDGPPEPARLKGDVRMVAAVDRAVAFFQDLPDAAVVAELPDRDVVVRPEHWREALRTCTETSHVPLRDELLEAVGELLSAPEVRRDRAVRRALWASWPDLSAAQVVRDLLGHRALLRHCAPWLAPHEQAAVVADAREHDGWHVSDLPLLDRAHARLGLPPADAVPAAELRARRSAAAAAVADLLEAAGEGSALHLLRDTTTDGLAPLEELLEPADAQTAALTDRVFAHVVVDEAQDLTGTEWVALLRRCPARAVTAVGDRAQSREPFDEGWAQRLAAVGLPDARVLRLSVNYRTPSVLMAPAAAVITAARPSVLVPDAVRPDGRPLVLERLAVDVDPVDVGLARARALVADGGTAAVVAPAARHRPTGSPAVTFFTPADLQGLEMDAVVVVEPAELWDDTEGAAASLYVTLTRATQAVCVLHSRDLPACALPLLDAARRACVPTG